MLTLALAVFCAAPPGEADDTHDLVILHEARPCRIRLHLRVNGEPFSAPWARRVGRLFRHLDTDGDGVLSPQEAALAPGRDQWQQMSVGDPVIDPEPAPAFNALARGKKSVTVADLEAYYSGGTAGPLTFGCRPPYNGDPLTGRLWDTLQPRGEPWRKVTLADVKSLAKRLAPLDENDDDIITAAELLGLPADSFFDPPPLLRPANLHGPATGGLPFVSVRPDGSAAQLEKALRAAYPRRTVKAGPPDAAIRFDMGRDALPRVVGSPPKDFSIQTTRGGLLLTVRGWLIHIHLEPPPDLAGSRREDARAVFKSLDANSNGYLDTDEVARPPFRFVSWLRLADADRDGKVTEAEFVRFAGMLDGLHGRRLGVELSDLSRSLFAIFDTDGDGRLGARELRDAWRMLPGLDRGLTRGELPQVFRLTVNVGKTDLGEGTGVRRPFVPPERGPVWFRRMDRNRDGDVSPSEWLGTKEEFDRIDTDRDGLIGPEEAEAYDRLRRPVGRRKG